MTAPKRVKRWFYLSKNSIEAVMKGIGSSVTIVIGWFWVGVIIVQLPSVEKMRNSVKIVVKSVRPVEVLLQKDMSMNTEM